MRRDLDLIRALLLNLEAIDKSPTALVTFEPHDPEVAVDGYTPDQIDYHLSLIYEAGFVVSGDRRGSRFVSGDYMFERLSWEGHEFLDAIRDEEVWRRTKDGARKAGGWTLDVVKDLGTAYLKHIIKERVGIDLD